MANRLSSDASSRPRRSNFDTYLIWRIIKYFCINFYFNAKCYIYFLFKDSLPVLNRKRYISVY